MAIAKEGKIILDIEETAGTNVTSITAANNRYVADGKQEVKQPPTTTLSTLRFESFEQIQVEALFVNEEKEIQTEDNDGWILVRRRQRHRRYVKKLHPSPLKKLRLHKSPHHANAKNKTETTTRQRLSTKTYCLDPNRITVPLFILGFIQEQKVNCILIDGGSVVNIMPKSTMKKLGITLEDLSRSRLKIQGFNQRTQRAIGMTRLDLTVGKLKASTLFHIIDARTSYNLLLGKSWLHENGIVPSILHQCLEYIKHREIVKVDAVMKPFTEAKSYFVDSNFYLDPDSMQEVLPSKVLIDHSIEEVHPRATAIENNNEMLSKATKNEASTSEKHEVKKLPYSPMFWYVVQSNGKEKQNQQKDHSPLLFNGRKQLKEARVEDLQEIKTKLVTPITNLYLLI
ncbi:hypothetical protein Sango_0264700 [Sesamum angolense]|uniref:Uncharacterized protein n=1 Tax=Sesamum angolense TaxID=2727404 RepID=A0AAE2C7H6_9LAMI|nr:hypothetical protein Sango_0264700 [Sesamum angolense]